MNNHKNRHSTLFRTIAMAMVCLFLVNDIAWTQPAENHSSITTLAAESRLKRITEFFNAKKLDLKNMVGVIEATLVLNALFARPNVGEVELRKAINGRNTGTLNDGAVKIEEMPQDRTISGRSYKYVIFNFVNQKKTVEALFLKGYSNLSPEEQAKIRQELGISDKEKHRLDCPGLEDVWFIDPEKIGASASFSSNPGAGETEETGPGSALEQSSNLQSSGDVYSDEELKRRWDALFERGGLPKDPDFERRSAIPAMDVGEFFDIILIPNPKALPKSLGAHSVASLDFTKKPDSMRLYKGLRLGGLLWDILPNEGFRKRYAALVVPSKYSPQQLCYQDVMAFIELLSKTNGFAFYHSLGGGASMNSKHIQLYQWVPRYFQRLVADSSIRYDKVGKVLMGHPDEKSGDTRAIILKSENPMELAAAAWVTLRHLQLTKQRFNLLGRGNTVMIIPRRAGTVGALECVRTFPMYDERLYISRHQRGSRA